MEATIRDYGTVEFDATDIEGNAYDLYCICVCEGEQVVSEEHYTDEDEFRTAISDKDGRELMDEREEFGWVEADTGYGIYECEAVYHLAYVIDHEEE